MIDGNTLLFATPGNPVTQIRLPQVMEAVFAALRVNAVWVPMHVERDGLDVVLQALRKMHNFRGITVAIPFKPVIGDMLDGLTLRARASGSVNLVRRDADGSLQGDMVDGAGFVRGLQLHGHSVAGATAWLVGVGGGGSAIAASLAEAGVGRLYLTEADPQRADAMVARLSLHYPSVAASVVTAPPGDVDFAINATPCGLQADDPLPFDPASLPPAATVCDIIMKPKDTALLQAASHLGMRVHYGHHMLDTQIPMYMEYLGIAFPDEATVIRLASQA